MRRMTSIFALAAAIMFACFVGVAFAAPTETGDGGGSALDIGALSDRYESLKDLSTSLTNEEGVVIATRIGVLTSANRALNNSDVSFSGEVVGDIMNAGEGYKWLNLRGSSNAVLSVYATDDQVSLIQYMGDYHDTGTTLRIAGTYHIACPEHEGELDVHATSAEVVDSGGPVTRMVSPAKFGLATGLCALAVMVLAAFLWARWYREKREDS